MSRALNLESTPQSAPTGYQHHPVTKVPNWHGLVALDMLFNNLSTGLYLAAGLGELVAPAAFRPLAVAAFPIALLMLIADLVCLVLDLGDRSRFHHMLRVWKPSSPMSLGTWALTAYAVPLTLLTLTSVFPTGVGEVGWLRDLLLVAGAVFALGAAVYKGVLFSTTAQPGWRNARWLGAYLANSALVLGVAELLVLAILMGQPAAVVVLRPALMLLLVLNLIALGLLVADVRRSLTLAHDRGSLAAIAVMAILLGLILPLGLLALESPVPLTGAAILIVLGAAIVRLEIQRLPHILAHTRIGPSGTAP